MLVVKYEQVCNAMSSILLYWKIWYYFIKSRNTFFL